MKVSHSLYIQFARNGAAVSFGSWPITPYVVEGVIAEVSSLLSRERTYTSIRSIDVGKGTRPMAEASSSKLEKRRRVFVKGS